MKDEEYYRRKAYNQAHRAERKASNEAHKEEIKTYSKQYRLTHVEQIKTHHQVYNHNYQITHKAEIAQYHNQYNHDHPEQRINNMRAYRARVINAEGTFTQEEFTAKCRVLDNVCTYCGRAVLLVPDHIIPLSRGGTNNIDNIAPACAGVII